MFIYEVYCYTDVGPVRKKNEDHVLVGRFVKNRGWMEVILDHEDDILQDYGLLLAVADGIGGDEGGAIASQLALTTLERHSYSVSKKQTEQSFKEGLELAIEQANQAIVGAATESAALASMGCTLCGIYLTPHGYLVFNVGDSRVYRIRDGFPKPLTADDSVGQRAIRLGLATLEQAEAMETEHDLVNWLGRKEGFSVQIEWGPILRDGDILLVCSDGLHGLVNEEAIGEVLASPYQPMKSMGDRLAELAITQGGSDNISVLLLRASEKSTNHPEAK